MNDENYCQHLDNYFEKTNLDEEDLSLRNKYYHLNSSIKKLNINDTVTKVIMSTSSIILIKESLEEIFLNSGSLLVGILSFSSIVAGNYLHEDYVLEKASCVHEKISIYTKVRRKELGCKNEENEV